MFEELKELELLEIDGGCSNPNLACRCKPSDYFMYIFRDR